MKEQVLKTVEEATAARFAHSWACALWASLTTGCTTGGHALRDIGTLVDRAPGGSPVHELMPSEVEAVLAVAEKWGPIGWSHRKPAHRDSNLGAVWVSPSTFRRLLAAQGLVLADPPARTPSARKPCRTGWCGRPTASGSGTYALPAVRAIVRVRGFSSRDGTSPATRRVDHGRHVGSAAS